MAVVHDVTTTILSGSIAASPTNVNHVAGARASGVIVCIFVALNTDVVTGVTYGGVTMTRVRFDSTSSTETGSTYIYFLGYGKVPTGTQAVAISYTGTTAKSATCTTVKSNANWDAMGVATVGGYTNTAVSTETRLALGTVGQSDSAMGFEAAYSGTAGPMSSTAPMFGGMTSMIDTDFGNNCGGCFRQTNASDGVFTMGHTQASDDWCSSGISVVEWATDWSFLFPTPEWDEEDTFPPPPPDVKYLNNFDGGPNAATISTVNSGGNSGRAWDTVTITGSGASLVYDAGSSLTGRGAFGALATGGSTNGQQMVTWSGLVDYDNLYMRMYMRAATSSISEVIVQFGSTGAAVFLNSGQVVLKDASNVIRYTSAKTFALNEAFRLETFVRNGTSGGHIQARLFWGTNIDGYTPNESVGSATDPWNTGINQQVSMGLVGLNTTQVLSFDSLAVSTSTWIGPEVQPEYNDGIWPYPDFDPGYELILAPPLPAAGYNVGVPASDVSMTGWVPSPSQPELSFHLNIDDGVTFSADGTDTLATAGSGLTSFTVGFNLNPGRLSQVRVFWRAVTELLSRGVNTALLDGATVLATGPTRTVTSSVANFVDTYSGVSLDADNLYVRLTAAAVSPQLFINMMWVEVIRDEETLWVYPEWDLANELTAPVVTTVSQFILTSMVVGAV